MANNKKNQNAVLFGGTSATYMGCGNYQPNAADINYLSIYTTDIIALRPTLMAAVADYVAIELGKVPGAIGSRVKRDGDRTAAIEIELNGIRYAAEAKGADGTYACGAIKMVGSDALASYPDIKKEQDAKIAILIAAIEILRRRDQMEVEKDGQKVSGNNQMGSRLKDVEAVFGDPGDDASKAKSLTCELANAADYVYHELLGTIHDPIVLFNASGNIGSINAHNIRDFIPNECEFGEFKVLTTNFSTATTPKTVEEAKNKEDYTLSPDRELSREEEFRVPEMPKWFVVPEELTHICKLAKKTTDTYKPARNFMLRGPSSVGKTTIARALAAMLGLPYVTVTCGSNTEIYSFIGQPMYDKDGVVKYHESPFMRAIKNGWVCEIQEPFTISKPGILTELNGLLDDTGKIVLPTGETVERHPDCVLIFTTNTDYVGCKDPNQSFIRRMNLIMDFDEPDADTLYKRVSAVTQCSNKTVIRKMIGVQNKIQTYLIENSITDGVCGTSELIDWVMQAQVFEDLIEAANYSIVSKSTSDREAQNYIRSLIESVFKVGDTI